MKRMLVSLFALVMLSVGFAGQWEFVEKHDDATNKDRSYIRLDSESDPDTSVIVIRCNGADQFAAYITTAELFIHKTGTDDGGSSPLYTQVEWKFDSQDATTDLLTVAVSREAVFFSTDEQLGSFFGGLNAGGTFWIKVLGVDGYPATYTFEVTDTYDAVQLLSCF